MHGLDEVKAAITYSLDLANVERRLLRRSSRLAQCAPADCN